MTFSQPLVAGETILQDVHSEGFEEGTTGWIITRDGEAQFNNVTVRGQVEVNGDGVSFIKIQTISGDPVITFQNEDFQEFNLEILDTSGIFRMWDAELGSPTYFQVPGEGIAFEGQQSRTVGFDHGEGFLKVVTEVDPWTSETWHNFAASAGTVADVDNFSNGWTNLGGNWETAGYRKMPDGTVRLKGSVVNGTKTDNTIMATLPTGYRPAKDINLMGGNGSAAGTSPSVRIFSADGTIRCFGISGTVSGAHAWDGLSFPVASLT